MTTTAPTRHQPWCDQAEHARMESDGMGGAHCAGPLLLLTLPDGRELGGWWRQEAGLPPRFVIDAPLDADLPPRGVRDLLAALDGAPSPLAAGLRTLLTDALAQVVDGD